MMRRIAKLQKDSQGFTLVELMIVVAIIGILAAIAIPQFSAYRIRGFNASALSDVRNLQTSQAAFFADHQLYASTLAAPDDTTIIAAQPGALLAGPQALATSVISQFVGGAIRTVGISIGNGVTVVANHNAGASASNGAAKHLQGDTVSAFDSDATLVYSNAGLRAVSAALQVGDAIAAAINTDEFAAAGGAWVAR